MKPHLLEANYRLLSNYRNVRTNYILGLMLAMIAGYLNAGGFLLIGIYTSHMTGMVASFSDNIVLGGYDIAANLVAYVLVFVSGAAMTGWCINVARYRNWRSKYALPMAIEGGLLSLILGSNHHLMIILILCFVMGLQNAMITKISSSEIRTTHMTGVLTDIGIGLGRWLAVKARIRPRQNLINDRHKLGLNSMIFGGFIVGSLLGAASFSYFGTMATVPIIIILLWLSLPLLLANAKAKH